MEDHENILTELALSYGAPPSSNFNMVLQFFVSSSRPDIHRKNLAISPFLNYVSFLIQNNLEDKTDSYKLICTLLKVIRNICAGEITNQSSFIHDGGLGIVASLAKQLILHCSCKPNLSSEGLDVCQMILQLLGNVCLAGEEQQSAVWRAFFPEIFAGFSAIQNVKIYEPLCMVICTCCKDKQGRLEELCGNNGCPIFAGLFRTSHTVGIEGDWLELLLTRICFVKQYFMQIFTSLREPKDSSVRVKDGKEIFSVEQAHLLHLIANFTTHQMEEISLLVNSRECNPAVKEFVTFIVEIVQESERIIDNRPGFPPSIPTGFPAIDALGYSLNILRDICACEDSPSFSANTHQIQETGTFSVVDMLVSSGLIKLMIHLLRELGPPETVEKATMQGSAGNSNSSPKDVHQFEGMVGGVHRETITNTITGTCCDPSVLHAGDRDWMVHVDQKIKVCPYKGYRRDIVSVLANATFRRKHVQDEIRECGGLFLLLQQCVVDEKNPYLREWGLWAIRNLLEGNIENQREVAELELQSSVNTPAIAEMGLRVEIDPNSRKPKLVNLAT